MVPVHPQVLVLYHFLGRKSKWKIADLAISWYVFKKLWRVDWNSRFVETLSNASRAFFLCCLQFLKQTLRTLQEDSSDWSCTSKFHKNLLRVFTTGNTVTLAKNLNPGNLGFCLLSSLEKTNYGIKHHKIILYISPLVVSFQFCDHIDLSSIFHELSG